jgi:hypothetical protein
MVTARAAGAGSGAFALTNLPAPQVIVLERLDVLHHRNPFVLSFSEPMDAARAGDRANYRLVDAGRDHRFGTLDDRVIRIHRPRYNATSGTVTIRPFRRLSPHRLYRLTVSGTPPRGLTVTAGTFLAGMGPSGSDFVVYVGSE